MLSEQPKEAICETLKLPRDVLLGEMLISFVGRRQMVVENYRNLILYTDTCIRLQGRSGRLSVAGSRLGRQMGRLSAGGAEGPGIRLQPGAFF